MSFGDAGPIELEGFWIDRYEVTNEQYKAFIDDDGYRNRELWHDAVPWDKVSELLVEELAVLPKLGTERSRHASTPNARRSFRSPQSHLMPRLVWNPSRH